MKGNLKPIIVVALIVVLLAGLFIADYKTSNNSVQATSNNTIGTFEVDKFLLSEVDKLNETNKKLYTSLNRDLSNEGNLLNLISLWDSVNVPMVSALFATKLAQLKSNETNWMIAGSKFYNAANFTSDSIAGLWALKEAKVAYNKALEINPTNLQAKNALAVCIIQADNDVMKGVGMLKEVIATDSNNIQAIFTLGMLSIQSNQLEKAAERFEKLIILEPFNPEYYFYLGEVYAKMGNTQKAIKTYETCKTLLSDKEAKKEIDNLIKKLTKI